MAIKIYITGNFLVAEDTDSRTQYFKVNTRGVHHKRSADDDFAFFQEGLFPQVSNEQPQYLQLGVQRAWEWNTRELEQKSQTTFAFSEIRDKNGDPYVDSDTFDQYLNDNLGASGGCNVVVNGKHSELILDDGTNPHGTTQSDVGLGNVDNTSDLDKPISNATQLALNGKLTIPTTFNWTLDFNAVLTGDIYPNQSSTIASVSDIVGSPITTILINGSSYTFGDAIISGDKITVTVDVASVIDLNFTI